MTVAYWYTFLGHNEGSLYYIEVEPSKYIAQLAVLLFERHQSELQRNGFSLDDLTLHALPNVSIEPEEELTERVRKGLRDGYSTPLKSRSGVLAALGEPDKDLIQLAVELVQSGELVTSRPSSTSQPIHERLPSSKSISKEAWKWRKSPSSGSKTSELRSVQKPERIDAMYNYRPLELSPPPVTIYSSAFAEFTATMAVDPNSLSFTHQELDLALSVVTISLQYHENDRARLSALRSAFGSLVHVTFLAETPFAYHRDYAQEVKPDGHVYLDGNSNPHQILTTIVEGMNEIGDGGTDPIAQAECLYVTMCTSLEFANVRSVSCCPAFLVGIAGPNLAVSGAIFGDHLISQRLTDYISLVPLPGRSQRSPLDATVHRVAQLCRALKQGINLLEAHYRALKIPTTPSPSLTSAPGGTSAASRRPSPFENHYLGPHLVELKIGSQTVSLTYTRRLAIQEANKTVFCANMRYGEEQQSHPVVVKFTTSYCADAHRLLADLLSPRAPKLHFCERVEGVGNLIVVIMDYIKPAKSQTWTAEHSKSLRTAVEVLHGQGYVHGDLREPNVILMDDKNLLLIDFDWCGIEGGEEVRYPSAIFLDSRIGWHSDVQRGGKIQKSHDLHFVEKLAALEGQLF